MLRAQNVGLPTAMAPWVMVVMSIVYAAVSYPAGAAADRGHGPRLLSAGLVALIVSDLVLANAHGGADGLRGRGPVGAAHGPDAGPARGAGRRGGAGRPRAAPRSASSIWSAASRCSSRACSRAGFGMPSVPGFTFYAGAALDARRVDCAVATRRRCRGIAACLSAAGVRRPRAARPTRSADLSGVLAMPTCRRRAATRGSYLYYRHTLPVRLMHWINVVALTILLMSGLQIFNAHPGAVLGQVVVHGRAAGAPDRHDRARRFRLRRRHAGLRSRIRHHGGPRNLDERERPAGGARIPVVGDDSGQSLALDGARLAFLLRVGAASSTASPTSRYSTASRHLARDLVPTAATGGRSAARSSITCASGIRRARRRSATTCCRSSPTSS